jgi:hypothetical protein
VAFRPETRPLSPTAKTESSGNPFFICPRPRQAKQVEDKATPIFEINANMQSKMVNAPRGNLKHPPVMGENCITLHSSATKVAFSPYFML